MFDSYLEKQRESLDDFVQDEDPWYGFFLAGSIGFLMAILGEYLSFLENTIFQAEGPIIAFSIAGGYFVEGGVYRIYSYITGDNNGNNNSYPLKVKLFGTLCLITATIFGFNPNSVVGELLTLIIFLVWITFIWVIFSENPGLFYSIQILLTVLIFLSIVIYLIYIRLVEGLGTGLTNSLITFCINLVIIASLIIYSARVSNSR